MCKLGDIVIKDEISYIVVDINGTFGVVDYKLFCQSFYNSNIELRIIDIDEFDFVFGELNKEALLHLIQLVYDRK